MPSGITEFGAGAWLSALFGISADISTYYVALLSDAPGVDADGDVIADLEPDDTAYARQSYAAGAVNWGVDGSILTNLLEIDFPVPLIDWGNVSHYALCTAATSGDVYAFGEFANTQYVDSTFQLTVPVGGLVISLSAIETSVGV